MKIRSIFFAAASAFALASCGGKVSDMTQISGTVASEEVTEVRVQAGDLDTLVTVTEGKFSLDIPADLNVYASIKASGADFYAMFIPDGTPLTVTLAEESSVTSKYPEISVQEKLNVYETGLKTLMDEYSSTRKKIYSDSIMTKEEMDGKFEIFYDEFSERYKAHHLDACAANTDNFVSVIAMSSLRGQVEDAEMETLINSLSPALQEHKYVAAMKAAISARLATAPGSKFVDFTAEHVYGYSRSMDPQPLKKEVKFSDYVGKGKYVLVDFWSPWCGPCRREIPNIQEVYKEYKKKGLEVLSLAVWERKPQSHTIEVAGELGMDWLHINNCGSVPTEIYGVEGIPHLMLIGPDGTILERGFHGLEGIKEAVAKHI